jgi:hypothetical protein
MHKIGTVFALVISLIAISAFAAETPLGSDLKQIQSCIEQAEKGDSSGTGCAGTIADPCIQKTENGRTETQSFVQSENWRFGASCWVRLLQRSIRGDLRK